MALPQYCGIELSAQTKAGEHIVLDGERLNLPPYREPVSNVDLIPFDFRHVVCQAQ